MPLKTSHELPQAYDSLKTLNSTLLSSVLNLKNFFLYMLDREGPEYLPLYLNSHIYQFHRSTIVDISGSWFRLIYERLSLYGVL